MEKMIKIPQSNDELYALSAPAYIFLGEIHVIPVKQISEFLIQHDRQLFEKIEKEVIGKHLAGNKILNQRIDEQRTALAKLKEEVIGD